VRGDALHGHARRARLPAQVRVRGIGRVRRHLHDREAVQRGHRARQARCAARRLRHDRQRAAVALPAADRQGLQTPVMACGVACHPDTVRALTAR